MKISTGIPTLCVSQTLMMGWCDEKVADVVWAVAQEKDASLQEVLVQATIEGGLFKNFLPLPFTEHSSYGQRLMRAWEVVKKTYPDSETAQTFVWRFWQPMADSINAHLMHNILGEAWMLPVDARARAFGSTDLRNLIGPRSNLWVFFFFNWCSHIWEHIVVCSSVRTLWQETVHGSRLARFSVGEMFGRTSLNQ